VERQENAGPAAARNRGIELATGAIVLFVDDDVVAHPHLIEQHVARHDLDGEGTVVIGPMLTPDDFTMSPWVQWEQAMLYKQYAAMERGEWEPTSRQFYTGNASVARERLLAIGGFDVNLRRAEDVEMAFRLGDRGARFVFCPDAIGYHYAERSFDAWLNIAEAYGGNDVLFARDHGRPGLIDVYRREYLQRPRVLRLLARTAMSHRSAFTAVTRSLLAVRATNRVTRIDKLDRVVLSLLYGVAYYCGMADVLGGPKVFARVMRGAAPPPAATQAPRVAP